MENSMQQLRQQCLSCENCPLAKTRHNVVFGVGVENAEVVFIGEGPGENEDLQGEPFVGKGGALLDKYLTAIDLSRDKNIYITNMVKCRPPQNRDPKPEEIANCIGYLTKQLEFLKPKIVVCLGRIAAGALIEKGFKVTKQHGQWFQKDGVWMMGTYHRRRCCATPPTSRTALRTCWRCRPKSARSASTPTTAPSCKMGGEAPFIPSPVG